MKPLIYLIGCSNKKGGNSDRALQVAGEGIEKKKFFHLKDYNWDKLIKKLKDANGVIFGTPIYFGDGSSLLFEFLRECRKEKNLFLDKAVGFIDVGAKRNGGQETAIVFNAWEVMGQGALVLNDGHPISQFGGTCVAGKHSGVEKDERGITQVKGVARRVQETASLLMCNNLNPFLKTIYLLMEPNRDNEIKMPVISDYGDSFYKLKTYQHKIKQCRACLTCPDPRKPDDFKCRYEDCDMFKLHPLITGSQVLVPIGFDMRFFERMRYLRRDNFRLSFHVVRVSELRHIHIFLKLNSLMCRKFCLHYGKIIQSGLRQIQVEAPKYEPIGH